MAEEQMEELTVVDLPARRAPLNSCSTETCMANLTITIEKHILYGAVSHRSKGSAFAVRCIRAAP
jgi:hypothetical protein